MRRWPSHRPSNSSWAIRDTARWGRCSRVLRRRTTRTRPRPTGEIRRRGPGSGTHPAIRADGARSGMHAWSHAGSHCRSHSRSHAWSHARRHARCHARRRAWNHSWSHASWHAWRHARAASRRRAGADIIIIVEVAAVGGVEIAARRLPFSTGRAGRTMVTAIFPVPGRPAFGRPGVNKLVIVLGSTFGVVTAATFLVSFAHFGLGRVEAREVEKGLDGE